MKEFAKNINTSNYECFMWQLKTIKNEQMKQFWLLNSLTVILALFNTLNVTGQEEPDLGWYSNIDTAIAHKDKVEIFTVNSEYLPKEVYSFPNLWELIFKAGDSIPDDLYKIPSLRCITIRSKDIKKFPESICKIDSLECLMIYPDFTELPECIGRLKNLKKIWIFNDSITCLPASIFDLPKLESLFLRGYPENTCFSPEYIDSLKKRYPRAKIEFESMKMFNLDMEESSKHVYTSLEEALKNPNDVYQLHLQGWTKPFPKEIYRLKRLKVLDITSSYFTSLPEDFYKLDSLSCLIGEFCKLESLPDCIGKMKSLRSIVIVYSEIKHIPESIGNLTDLAEIRLGGCPISKLPASIYKLQKLESLDFYHQIKRHTFTRAQKEEIISKFPNCKVRF